MDILNVIEPSSGVETLFQAIIFGVIALLLLMVVVFAVRDHEIFLACVLGAFFVAMALCSVGAAADYLTPDPAKYEVLITDMSAFDTSKYEVVEQRGKIFVVQEIAQ